VKPAGRLKKFYPLAVIVGATVAFRASQNAGQSSASLLGHQLLHLNPLAIGISASVSGAAAAVTALLVAGRIPIAYLRKTVAVAVALLAVAVVAEAVATTYLVYTLALIALGAAGGVAMPGLATLSGFATNDPSRGIAIYSLSLSGSLALGPAVETLVIGATDGSLRIAIGIFSVFALVGSFVLFATGKGDRSLDGAHAGSFSKAKDTQSLWRSRAFLIGIDAQLLYQVPFVAIVTFGALIAKVGYHASTAGAEAAFTVFFVSSLLTRSVMAVKGSSIPVRWLFRTSAVLTVFGLLTVLYSHNLIGYYLAMAALGVPHGIVLPAVLAVMARGLPVASRTRANAAVTSIQNLLMALSPVVLGLIGKLAGVQAILTLTLIPVVLLAIPLFVVRVDSL
jgi:MFS family permease